MSDKKQGYSAAKSQSIEVEGDINKTATSIIHSPYKTVLDNMLIRDATQAEKTKFSEEVTY